ncbi:MAG: SH3 domain-containing protein [Synechococcales bacterium]|nr:SH3 domain-containing protein [Synechococcales bacterium]
MSQKSSSSTPLVFGIWFTAGITLGGIGYATLKPKASQSMIYPPNSSTQFVKASHCRTIVTDPQPPLNVRSSPVVAPDNVVGHVNNGTQLAVVGENEGWLQISAPLQGWVYQELTITHCNPQGQMQQVLQPAGLESPAPRMAIVNRHRLTQARAAFHAGDLTGAIAHLNAVSKADPDHAQAQVLLRTMPAQWQQAEVAYQVAQKALAAQNPQAVLAAVQRVPDIRYWRSRMAPLVQAAIAQNVKQPAAKTTHL